MPFVAELHRPLSESEEWGILALWRKGMDTYEISFCLGVHECEIANRLLRMRDLEKVRGNGPHAV